MNKYKIKSIVFSALWGMAILNSGAASCSKEKKLTELTEDELKKQIAQAEEELTRKASSQKDSSEKQSEKDK